MKPPPLRLCQLEFALLRVSHPLPSCRCVLSPPLWVVQRVPDHVVYLDLRRGSIRLSQASFSEEDDQQVGVLAHQFLPLVHVLDLEESQLPSPPR